MNETLIKDQVTESTEKLKELLPVGSDVYAIVKKVAPSGMSRHIDFYTFKTNADGKIVAHWLSWDMDKIGIGKLSRKTEALLISGCGMDMTFATVYNLAQKLYGDGYKLNRINL